ncbi:MAG: Manganese-binding lipoprotein MntA [Opitutia bacterium UBA7350]|nr:MAG: Manganese-binding lipoprotein MntA [Opitutae bacterium UBA7350]
MAFLNHFSNLKFAPLLAGLLAAFPSAGWTEGAVSVWVTIEPQANFVKAVGGDVVEVRTLVRPGQCVELYAPSPRDMIALSQAAAYFRIGVPVEATITSRLEVREKQLRFFGPVFEVSTHVHESGHCEFCGTEDSDPHVWLDPIQMIEYADTIETGLSELLPEYADQFKANAEQLKLELRQLHNSLKVQFAKYVGRSFYINHPSLVHFAKRYGLKQRSIEHAGSAPSARQMVDLIKAAREAGIGGVLTQPEFGRSSAAVMADALEVPLMEVNILGRDYFSNMLGLASALERSFAND